MPTYDYNISQATRELLPPSKRKTNNLAYLGAPGYVLQRYHTLFFNLYANGNMALDWTSGGTYKYEDQVRYTENSRYNNRIYELTNKAGITGLTTPPSDDTVNWILVQNNFIGVSERARYAAPKVVIEYALNKWFKTTFRQPPLVSDIFLTKELVDNQTFVIGATEEESSAIAYNDQLQKSFISDEYITNKHKFAINIPLAVYDSLTTQPSGFSNTKDKIIRSFADNYVMGGITYTIITY
jgi:hypothetical protein